MKRREREVEAQRRLQKKARAAEEAAALAAAARKKKEDYRQANDRLELLKMARVHTNDETYIGSSEPALRQEMDGCRKRTWSEPVIQVSKS